MLFTPSQLFKWSGLFGLEILRKRLFPFAGPDPVVFLLSYPILRTSRKIITKTFKEIRMASSFISASTLFHIQCLELYAFWDWIILALIPIHSINFCPNCEDCCHDACRDLGIGIVPYSPLGRGFFAGKATVESLPANSSLVCILSIYQLYQSLHLHVNPSWRFTFLSQKHDNDWEDQSLFISISCFFCKVSHPRFRAENLNKNKTIYSRLENIAKKHQCSPSQLALAWILQQGDDVVPIPGQYLSLVSLPYLNYLILFCSILRTLSDIKHWNLHELTFMVL